MINILNVSGSVRKEAQIFFTESEKRKKQPRMKRVIVQGHK